MVKLIVRLPEKKRERLPLFRSRPATLAKKEENLASHSRIRITARQGKYIGGQPKLGFDIVDRRYVVNEVEAGRSITSRFEGSRRAACEIRVQTAQRPNEESRRLDSQP